MIGVLLSVWLVVASLLTGPLASPIYEYDEQTLSYDVVANHLAATAAPEAAMAASTYDTAPKPAPATVADDDRLQAGERRVAGASGSSLAASGGLLAPRPTTGLQTRGIRPAPGTRVRPEGIPDNWRIRNTRDPGGTWYYDPTNKGNAVRVMQGNPSSPFPNSQSPYVRCQPHGHPLDVFGNKLPTAQTPDAHIPLGDFRFLSELFR